MRVYKAAGGALVRAQRMEQTISPTLHGRTRTTALRGNVCMYVCEREVTAGMAGVTYVTFASVVGVRLCARASLTPTRTMYGCRQPWSRGYFAEGSSSVQVESRGSPVLPTLRIPQLLSSAPFLPSPPSVFSSFLPHHGLGSKAKASPLLHLRRERPCNSNETLPVPVYPGSRLRREVKPYSKRVQGTSPAEKLRCPGKILRNKMFLIQ